jgi:hypothetical protein
MGTTARRAVNRLKPVQLRVFGTVSAEGRQQLTIQVSSRRTGQKYGIGVAFEADDNSWLPLSKRNQRLVRFAWSRLRDGIRAIRRRPINGIHIEGTLRP